MKRNDEKRKPRRGGGEREEKDGGKKWVRGREERERAVQGKMRLQGRERQRLWTQNNYHVDRSVRGRGGQEIKGMTYRTLRHDVICHRPRVM